jgi:uracil-DNA glycosylase
MPSLISDIPPSWQPHLAAELAQPYIAKLEALLAAERAAHTIFPPAHQVFRALELTPFERVAVVILGQDPYHGAGQAHGLAFSVPPGVKPPPSLLNMYKELAADIGLPRPATGFLEPWAQQGVLLLNTALTVRANEANSHAKQGWERFTDAIIGAVANRADPAIFVLWGANAQKKTKLIDGLSDPARHTVIQSAHPSPLSARNGFFGSKPFSRINAALIQYGKAPINWQLDASANRLNSAGKVAG